MRREFKCNTGMINSFCHSNLLSFAMQRRRFDDFIHDVMIEDDDDNEGLESSSKTNFDSSTAYHRVRRLKKFN